MNLFQKVDMREGHPVRQIVRFAIPMLLGNVAQQFYSTCYGIENSQNIANALNTKFNPQPQIDAADGVEIFGKD